MLLAQMNVKSILLSCCYNVFNTFFDFPFEAISNSRITTIVLAEVKLLVSWYCGGLNDLINIWHNKKGLEAYPSATTYFETALII